MHLFLIAAEDAVSFEIPWAALTTLFAGGVLGLISGFLLGGRNSRLEEERRRTGRSEDAAKRIVETSGAIWDMHSGVAPDDEPDLEGVRSLLAQMSVDALLITDDNARKRLLTAQQVYNNINIAVMSTNDSAHAIAWVVNKEVGAVAGAVMRGAKQPDEMKETDEYADLIHMKTEEWRQDEEERRRAWREEQERRRSTDP